MKVVMLGPALTMKGGIASVQQVIAGALSREIELRCVATLCEDSAASKRAIVFLRAVASLVAHTCRGQADVVHIHFATRGSTVRKSILTALALALRRPVVLHAHSGKFPTFYAALPPFAQRAVRTLFRRCTTLIALSESWATFYRDTLHFERDRLIVLPNPVILPPAAAVPDRRRRTQLTMVFLGRIGPAKGAFDLLRAFAALPAIARSRARVVMAGDGDVEGARRLSMELSIADSVDVHAWLSREECDALLQRADALLLPSYAEGLPMAVLEAMAWGLPVITTPVGGIPSVVTHGHTGLLVQPGDIAELTRAMELLIGSEADRIRLGRAARHAIEPFAVGHYIDALLRVYAAAATRGATGAVQTAPATSEP